MARNWGTSSDDMNGFILNVYELDLTPVGERHLQLPIRIGRSSLNDVCVAHRLVSEFHARIEEVDDRLCVRDLNSKNGVLVEAVGSDGPSRIAVEGPVDLEPYGYEFLLSPLLRVRVRPANGLEAASARHSQARGSVLGNAALVASVASQLAEDRLTEGFAPQGPGEPLLDAGPPAAGSLGTGPPAHRQAPRVPPVAPPRATASAPSMYARPRSPAVGAAQPTLPVMRGVIDGRGAPSVAYAVPFALTRPARNADTDAGPAAPHSASPAVQPYASVFIEPSPGALALPLHGRDPVAPPPLAGEAPARHATLLEPRAAVPAVPPLAHTAWELGHGTLPAAALEPGIPAEPPGRSIEAVALRGLRELAASLVPGQPVESAADVVQLITKLHDAIEMFCRCFIPVREACSRFIPTDELERAAAERCQHRSTSYGAIERALEPHAVAAALLDWHSDDQDAPRAVEHILADLMLHHLALSQAAIEGTKALLDELSPARIDARRPGTPSVLTRLGLPGARERALWEAFVDRHAELKAPGRSFRELFGELFSRAFAAHYPGPGSGPSL